MLWGNLYYIDQGFALKHEIQPPFKTFLCLLNRLSRGRCPYGGKINWKSTGPIKINQMQCNSKFSGYRSFMCSASTS